MAPYRCGLLVERRSRFLCKAAMLTFIASILLLARYFPRGHPQPLSSLSQSRPITNRHLLAINFSVDIADQITECSEIHSLANDQLNNQSVLCEFVKTVPACQSDTGFIPYFQFIYCVMPINLLPLSMILLFFWLLFLFLFLGTTAEEYFCPALTVISQVLRLSQNVAISSHICILLLCHFYISHFLFSPFSFP
jgi:sodium/potassium/calcium exchanger 6